MNRVINIQNIVQPILIIYCNKKAMCYFRSIIPIHMMPLLLNIVRWHDHLAFSLFNMYRTRWDNVWLIHLKLLLYCIYSCKKYETMYCRMVFAISMLIFMKDYRLKIRTKENIHIRCWVLFIHPLFWNLCMHYSLYIMIYCNPALLPCFTWNVYSGCFNFFH